MLTTGACLADFLPAQDCIWCVTWLTSRSFPLQHQAKNRLSTILSSTLNTPAQLRVGNNNNTWQIEHTRCCCISRNLRVNNKRTYGYKPDSVAQDLPWVSIIYLAITLQWWSSCLPLPIVLLNSWASHSTCRIRQPGIYMAFQPTRFIPKTSCFAFACALTTRFHPYLLKEGGNFLWHFLYPFRSPIR